MSSAEGAALFVGDTTLMQAPGSTVVSGVRTYSGFDGKPVAQRSAKTGTTGTTVTWVFSGLDGTVDATVVPSTGVVQRTFRDPFGVPLGGASGVWGDGTGFLGKPVTASSKLTTVGARTYDLVLGKFTSVDPITDPSNPQQNLGYAYANNNPVTLSDPSGLEPINEACRNASMALQCNNYSYGGGTKIDPVLASQDPLGAYLQSVGLPSDFNPVAAAACNWDSTCYGTQPNRYTAGPGYDLAPGSIADPCPEANTSFGCENARAIGGLIVQSAEKLLIGLGDIWLTEGRGGTFGSGIRFRSDTAHIFRNAVGHLANDTPANRAVIRSAVAPQYLVGVKDLREGAQLLIYKRTLPNGSQAWAEVKNNEITNGGLNPAAK